MMNIYAEQGTVMRPGPRLIFTTAASILVVAACRSKGSARPQDADPSGDKAAAAGNADAGPSANDPDLAIQTITAVDVDTKLASICGLPSSRVHFKFDSAKVQPEAQQLLQQIATCAQRGPAQGKELLVVGRAGPLGADEYNQQLGLSRAYAVANFLRDRGVPEARLRTESKGEADAQESAPSSWPSERRVTIRLSPSDNDGGMP